VFRPFWCITDKSHYQREYTFLAWKVENQATAGPIKELVHEMNIFIEGPKINLF
jgi:hypothetical protein